MSPRSFFERAGRARWLAVSALAVTALVPSTAHANGRYPLANQVVLDPGNPSHIVVRTTYGIVQTNDAGTTWTWVCEAAVGYGGVYDPAIGVTQDGSLFAAIFTGLSVSRDHGCSWTTAPSPLNELVIDVAVDPNTPSTILALTSQGYVDDAGTDLFSVIVAASTDNGQTFAALGAPLPTDLDAETIDAAPSNPERLYVTGTTGTTVHQGVLERSDDRGATWTELPIDLLGQDAPYLSAIDPNDPDRIYVRLDGASATTVVMSTDGGMTFTQIYTSTDVLFGFALSPDGSKIAVGGRTAGLLMANSNDTPPTFTQVARTPIPGGDGGPPQQLQVSCLTWATSGLYVCANEYPDGFTIGMSADEGATFAPLYHLSELRQLSCSATSTAGTTCPTYWAATEQTLGIGTTTTSDAGTTDASVAIDAGTTTTPTASKGCSACTIGHEKGLVTPLTGAALASIIAMLRSRSRRRSIAKGGRSQR